MLDRGDAADLMDVLRHELGFSKSDKRFPRKDTCLAIYSHLRLQNDVTASLALLSAASLLSAAPLLSF